MTQKKCYQCGKLHEADRSCYIGPKKPHCSVECAKKTLKELREKKESGSNARRPVYLSFLSRQ